MARKRFIKPGFFCNEDLADLKFEYRILFQGLWCWSDREGRLEDRPKRLKSQIFPYDDVDVNDGLDLLASKNFIIRYKTTVKDADFNAIEIVNFKEHQDVHKNEQESIIPSPAKIGTSTEQAPANDGTCTPFNLELRTLDLELLTLNNNIKKREEEISEAIEDFFNPKQQNEKEKEKNSAQKEKDLFPSVDVFEQKISKTANWRNVLEHYKISEEVRSKWFKHFYETKEDLHRVRYPTDEKINSTDVSANFYWWIGKGENLQKLKKLAGIEDANTGNNSIRKGNSYQQSKNDVEDLMRQSEDFLQQSSG